MFFFVPGIVVIMLTFLGCPYLDGPKRTLTKPILPPPPIAREIGALVERRMCERFGIVGVLARASGGLRS